MATLLVRSTVFPAPVKLLAPKLSGFLKVSRAVTWIVTATPAVCVPIAPPPCFSTRKFAKAAGCTVNTADVPVCVPFPRPAAGVSVAVRVAAPLFAPLSVIAWLLSTPLVNVPVVPPPAPMATLLVRFTLFPVPVKFGPPSSRSRCW